MIEVNIVGGGISGLALGFFAKRAGLKFTIHEANNRCGGVISTEKTVIGDIHHGPHLVRLSPELEEVLHFLSVKTLISQKNGRFLLKNGKICKISPNFIQFCEIFISIFRKRKRDYASLGAFVRHHFGKTTANVQTQALVNGIFACNIDDLHETALKIIYFTEKRGIYAILRRFLAKNRGNRQKKQIIRPNGGFQSLIDALVEDLRENIVLCSKIRRIDKNVYNFITIPAYCVADVDGIPEKIAQICEKIRYQALSVATIFTTTPINIDGIGCLSNNLDGVLGVLFNSSAFEEKYISYSIFYKNWTKSQVEEWFVSVFCVEIVKSHHFEYKNAIPLYNQAVCDLIAVNRGNTRIFSNYSGQISLSDIFTNAKNEISRILHEKTHF